MSSKPTVRVMPPTFCWARANRKADQHQTDQNYDSTFDLFFFQHDTPLR